MLEFIFAGDNVSEEARDHARQVLKEYDDTNTDSRTNTGRRERDDTYGESSGGSDEHSNRVLGGYKATLKSE